MPFPTSRSRRRLTERSPRRRGTRRRGRPRPHRSGNPRVLILCEGARTEPGYFNALKTDRGLTSVVVCASRAGQAGPRGLWERVQAELRKDPGWDEIHCVLDHDGRAAAVDDLERRLADLGKRHRSSRIAMVLSDPCFEYWLLLHFQFTDRPFAAAGKGSTACDEVIERLRHHLPDYRKDDPRLFEQCRDRVDDAVRNAQRSESSRSPDAPRTDVGRLVARLLEIAARRSG